MSRLQLQLRDAAEREARAGAFAHPLRRVRWHVGSPVVATAAAALLVALAVGAGALLLRGEPEPAGLRVVATVELTGNPEQILPAFGSVWISDPVAGDVVRVDPGTRRVLARISVGSAQYVTMQPVGSELWVQRLDAPVLQRIDPETDTIAGRVRLRMPDGRPFRAFGVLASPKGVWADGSEGALLLDPETGAGRALVGEPTAESDPLSFSIGDDALWSPRSDGRVVRFDAATGEATGGFTSPLARTDSIGAQGGYLIAHYDNTIARLDTDTGRVLWRRTLGDGIGGTAAGGGLLWVVYSSDGAPDRLTALAADTGKTVTSTALDTFGSTGMAVVGQQIWISARGGQTVVLRR